MKGKGIILAGTQSSSGKTLLNAMVLCALKRRQHSVQPFKTGPDYIDTAYSSHYAGCHAYNLDFWLMQPEAIRSLAYRTTVDSFGVVEGVMGLIDGISPYSNDGSTLSLAELLDWPVLLVVPAAKQGRSIRATIRGFLEEAGAGRIQGIILNKVSGDSHADYLKRALHDLPVPVLGTVPILDGVEWPERHLGLQASQEIDDLLDSNKLADYAQKHLDMDAIIALIEGQPDRVDTTPACSSEDAFGAGKRLGIARDEAFHFYYRENLDQLKQWGFELVEFSPLNDATCPMDVDGLIIGGGFPESYADRLQANTSMKESVAAFIQLGKPCYAECGGLMYLCEYLIQPGKQAYEMVGLIPGNIHMTRSLQHFGYSECLFKGIEAGRGFRAHEFHYSYWDGEKEYANLWTVEKSSRRTKRTEGYRINNLHASYLHLYFPGAGNLFKQLFAPAPSQVI